MLESFFDMIADAVISAESKKSVSNANRMPIIQGKVQSCAPRGFKEFIEFKLNERASIDKQFKVTLSKPNKSIDECIKYIMGEMFKKCVREGNYGYAVNDCEDNSDLVAMAIHYYDEDDIKINSIGGSMPKAEPEKQENKVQLSVSTSPKPKKKEQKDTTPNIFNIFDFE